MAEKYNIAGYARISVDDELDRDNVSIENQKSIITDYVRQTFPGSQLTFFEDRDRSGYTFEQREGYQKMRMGLLSHTFDILIFKDFSRFSRRNSKGLGELEDLRDAGVRIISIGDGVDFPNDDDWIKIQLQFLLNEIPVTDTSKKVKNVIKRRQADGKWLCAAPYGYLLNKAKEFEIIPGEAEVIQKIYRLYNAEGWGYKKIANYLTAQNIPTPRMSEQLRREAEGLQSHRKAKAAWAIATVQGILDDDFYIGTLRQGKYTRAKINGRDTRRKESEQIVIENHHAPIIDYRTFAATRALRQIRTRSNYRGVKKYDNVYSGFLVCGDCGSPLFAMSRKNLAPAYTCGTYHRRGLAGCTSHHIRADKLDELLKRYIRKLMENCDSVITELNSALARESDDLAATEQSADQLGQQLENLREELKATKRQRIRDIMKQPENEAMLEALYDEMETDLQQKMDGLSHQIELLADKRNTMIQANRAAKTALEVFRDILEKDHLERGDLELIIEKIVVYEDHLDIRLKSDIDGLLRLDTQQNAANPDRDTTAAESPLVQPGSRRKDKVFDVHVVNEGDPLEIYTSKDGEVIFKKYSLMGGLSDFAGQICETLHKTLGRPALIADRDSIIALSGLPRQLLEKRVSRALEGIMEGRQIYQYQAGGPRLPLCDGAEAPALLLAAPILTEGDVMGCVLFADGLDAEPLGETEYKLAQTISGFLGRHMEA